MSASAQELIDRINGILIDAPPAKAKGKNGRGNGGRREYDFYPTPRWQTDHLLDRLDLHHPCRINCAGTDPSGRPVHGYGCDYRLPISVAEPCVGEGHIVNAIRDRYPEAVFITNDLDPSHEADSHMDAGDRWFHGFGTPAFDVPAPSWVITNPPFSAAYEILREAFEAATIGVAFLLRCTWKEPTKTGSKAAWLAEHPPTWELTMERTSYDASGGQDSATSAWFVWLKDWRPGDPQRIEIIPGRARKEQLL